ncbi:uncharacterized protein F4807DRAFT_465905 [Annulohypoxylon truncatum]|uniref:uncharacterized protein n=1 Tax=Annulohypoxylon truncatum TaxID=327061 RepID=UPI002008DEA8|nr:uncharacterized protein F4807DRAFT_465905 [Annulohypoxylon truncatum]KAI1204178.1 hypothetical protein F4807DRAFT_465905 [Annulohypoxylon truncatum]
MCFDLYVHNTAREHDTRHLSIINPVTGYTVYSPWQDPYMSPPCDYPHILEPIPPHQSCPFHPRCCRLQRHFVCRFKDGSCQTQVKYHHFVDEASGETNNTSFLSAYFGYNPSLLSLAGWFFKAGVEFALADKYRSQISQRLAGMVERDNGQARDMMDLTERTDLEARYSHLTYVINCSRQVLGQFAMLWDLNTGPGGLPPRPGGNPNPEFNAPLSRRLNLRTHGWVKRDDSPFYWPQLIQLWPNFEAGFLPFGDDPSVVHFGSTTMESQIDLNPMNDVNSSNPDVELEGQTPHGVLNHDMLVVPPASPFPGNVEELLDIKDCITVANTPASLTSSPLSSLPSELDFDSDFEYTGDKNNKE